MAALISGTGTVTKSGAGTLTLTGDSTYTGTTTIGAGTLSLGSGGTTGSVVGNIVDNGALIFNRSNALTYGGVISGTGTVTKLGAGTLTLTGDNTYTGITTVTNGTFVVDGSLASTAVNVQVNATLSGIGMIDGTVTVQNGGTLAPGQSPGALSLGGLVLASGSISRFELNTPGVVGGTGPAGNDLVSVSGNLTLGGTLDVAGAPSAGYYRLFDYGGALSGSYGSVSGGAFTPTVLTNISNQVNLSLLGAGQQMQFWDGGDGVGNGSVDGGAGGWTAQLPIGPACLARRASTISGEARSASLPDRREAPSRSRVARPSTHCSSRPTATNSSAAARCRACCRYAEC